MSLGTNLQSQQTLHKAELLMRLDFIAGLADQVTALRKLMGNSEKVSLAISKESLTILQIETGATFNWEIQDPRTAIACLAVSGEYEKTETDLIRIISQECDYVVDVGANVGYYAVNIPLMASNVKKLYAFEPLPNVYKQLRVNVELNNLDSRVEPFNLAVSNSQNEIELYVPNTFGSSAASSVELHPEVANSKVRVRSDTLDILYKQRLISKCDFLKIDVEGAEKFVLEGAQQLLSSERPVILAEILRKWSSAQGYQANDILKMLIRMGYKCFSIGEKLSGIEEISDETEETNFLFFNLEKDEHRRILNNLGITL